MNIVLGGSFQVKDPVTMKQISVQTASAEPASTKRQTFFEELSDNGRGIDFSQLTEDEKKWLDEELEMHNKEFAYTGKFLKFKYNEELNTSIVEVIDASTQEVIVSLPPEFLIDLSLKMKKILGIYIDEKL